MDPLGWIAATVILGISVQNPGAQGQNPAPPEIKLDFIASDSIPLGFRDGSLAAFIPFTPDQDLSRYRFRIFSFSAKGLPDVTLRPATTISPITNLGSPALSVAIDIAKLPRVTLAGDYSLKVEFGNAATSVIRSAKLVLAPAKLQVPLAYAARQELRLFKTSAPVLPPLPVREIDQQTAIRALTFFDNSQRTDPKDVTRATLVAKAVGIEAGASTSLQPVATETFPLGDSNGSIELRAPELAQPVSVPYKIRTTRSKAWIFISGSVGLLLGYLVRGKLVARKTLLQARRSAEEIVAIIERSIRNYPDSLLRKELRTILDTLEIAWSSDKPATVLDGASAATAAHKSAVERYNLRSDEAKKSIDTLEKASLASWPFPKQIGDRVGVIRVTAKSAKDKAESGDYAGALEELRQFIEANAEPLDEDGRRWESGLGNLSKSVRDPLFPGGAKTKEAIQKAPLQPQPRPNLRPVSSGNDISTWLQAISDSYVDAQASLLAIADALEGDLKAAIETLATRQDTKQVSAELRSATKALADALRRAAAEPTATISNLSAEVNSQLAKLPALAANARQDEVRTLLANRQYAEAAQIVIENHPAVATGPGLVSFSLAAIQKISALTRGERSGAPPPQFRYAVPITPATPTQKELLWVDAILTIFSTAIYLLVIFFTYSERFVGHWPEIFAIGVTAFAWDIGFDAALRKAGELKVN